MHQTMTLEIRHQILIDTATNEYVLRERFGNVKPIEWRYKTLDDAKAAHAKRQTFCKAIVASISPEAADAVADARQVDNLKAGNA